MTESVHLMPGHGTHHVADLLAQLLQAAEAGHIRGLVLAVTLKGSERVYCESAGSLHRDTLKALGASAVLHNELMSLVVRRETNSLF